MYGLPDSAVLGTAKRVKGVAKNSMRKTRKQEIKTPSLGELGSDLVFIVKWFGNALIGKFGTIELPKHLRDTLKK